MRITALMIDVDGVLVCGRPIDGRRWASTIEADLGLNQADLQREFFTPYWDDIITGQHSLPEVLAKVLRDIAPQLSPEALIDYWFANDARLDAQLLDEIDQLREKGVPIFLATNQEHLRAAYLIEQLGLGQHCDGIFYSAALGNRKPDRSFFEKAALLSNIPSSELLLVDDLPENVFAAREAGWQAVQWRTGGSLFEELAKLEAWRQA